MRLHRLELTGFGPFRERQVVDFDAFASDGIFLIAGRTGAGKSSVLDGVTFALYGGVPRYEGSERRLRSDHCEPEDPTRVAVEFSAGDRRWRVTRSPEYERPKQRGTGMTTEPHRAQLDELVEGEWVGRAARPVDVARELDEILGLSQQQFLQVILLAQNRFAEFLLAKNDERQRLLRRLFGTRTYEGYQAALEQRRRDAEHELAAAGDGVAMLVGEAERLLAADGLQGEDEPMGDVVTRLEAAGVGVQRAAYRADTLVREREEADAAHRVAEKAHAAAKALREKQEQRLRSRRALAELEAAEEKVSQDRTTLSAAVEAEALRAYVEAVATADAAILAADAEVETRRDEWDALSADDDAQEPTAADLTAIADRLTGELAVYAAAEGAESTLVRAAAELADGEATAREFEQLLAALDAARGAFPGQLAALDLQLTTAQAEAGAVASVTARRDELRRRLDAAREAERLTGLARDAEAAYLAAGTRLDRARAVVTDLLRRRLAGHAAELAAELIDGEACSVCGSTTHPAPAEPSDDAVTDDEITAAEAARDSAAETEKTAADAARSARDALAAAVAQAGGDDTATLELAVSEAQEAVRASEEAASRRDRLVQERDALAAAERGAAAEREKLASDLSELRQRMAGLSAEVEAARRIVDEARGEFDSVAARIADAKRRRSRATALADALSRADSAAATAKTARAQLESRIAGSGFTDVASVRGALRADSERARLEERVRQHDVALRTEKDRLRDLELELAGEPEEPVDVAVTAGALAVARERWSAAVDSAAHAVQTSERLADLVSRAGAAHAAIAGLAEDYAVVARLANTVSGRAPNTLRMTLESFVLAAELEEIVEAANLRLSDMSSGRYRLQHSDALAARGAASGLGLEIMDAHTGMARPAQSLSGGETFLASLALALGLAEVVTARAGGVRLDTLFIDEGFGSLDDDTLELAMRTLDELRQGGRTVGLISHVAAMKEQIPAQLAVEASLHGPSVIRQAAVDVAVSVA